MERQSEDTLTIGDFNRGWFSNLVIHHLRRTQVRHKFQLKVILSKHWKRKNNVLCCHNWSLGSTISSIWYLQKSMLSLLLRTSTCSSLRCAIQLLINFLVYMLLLILIYESTFNEKKKISSVNFGSSYSPTSNSYICSLLNSSILFILAALIMFFRLHCMVGLWLLWVL